MTVLNTMLLRVLLPSAVVGFTLLMGQKNLGLFNILTLPITLEIILALILLDMSIYIQHVLSHRIPLLWRLHRVHHADPDLDVTSGTRFHPLEIILSTFYKCFWIFILGPSVGSVVLFEILLNAFALFNHSNLYIPLGLDRFIRWFVVTPEMLRIHHSTLKKEYNTNFGFNLSIWDRLYRTYTNVPTLKQEEMNIGLEEYPDPKENSTLKGILLIPFYKK